MQQSIELYKRVFSLAFPMVLSNITVPLLGLVDAAVIGHSNHSWYLGGVATGSAMISVIFWLLSFLRMSTTGLAAQAYGANNEEALIRTFLQGVVLACLFSFFILFFHSHIVNIAFSLSDASTEVKRYGEEYFYIRIWSTPATLINLVIMGWLLGNQNATKPMILVILINSLNILLDVIFVVVLDFKVQGAAAASVIADYIGMLLGLYFVGKQLKTFSSKLSFFKWKNILTDRIRLLTLNRDIFLRSLCLQTAFTFMTFKGATLGDNVVAANVVLMNFLLIVSFAMDGFAYAMEAMVGKAMGAKNKAELLASLSLFASSLMSLFISLAITSVFLFFGTNLIDAITNISSVREQAYSYLPWLIALPLISMWCFLLDGIFIGATRGREMRNSMFVSIIGFFAIWWVCVEFFALGNHALWAAMTSFMLMRGLTLGLVFYRHWRANTFIS